MEVARDDEAFLGLIGDVLQVLDTPVPPEPSSDCAVCSYRQKMLLFEEQGKINNK